MNKKQAELKIRPHHIWILILIIVLLPLQTLLASTHLSTNEHWRSLESTHFHIHFPERLASTAIDIANIAEQVHQELSSSLSWPAADKSNIVLSDQIDTSNGHTKLFPHNTIILITTPPNDAYSLEQYDNWLKILFRHEYVHLLHLDQAAGLPEALRNAFGRFPLLYPNIFQPPWLKEGLATYLETNKESKEGRGNSAYFQGLMKEELKRGFKPLSQVNMPTTEWPIGRTPYLYGYYFWDFIHQRYGEEKAEKLIQNFTNNLIPFRINSNSQQVLGKSLEPLWHEFETYVRTQLSDTYPTSAATPITPKAEISSFAKYVNGELYYIEQSRYRASRLIKQSRNGNKVTLSEVHGYHYDVHPQQGILLIQSEYHNNGIYNEIFHIHEDGSQQQLTQMGRYRSVAWHPDGKRFYAVSLKEQTHRIEEITLNGERRELWQGNNEIIGTIDIDPKGNQLAAAVWQPQNRWDIALFDIKQQQWHIVDSREGVEAQVQFTPSGKELIFSADYDGIYNIYQLNLDDHRLYQLTQENSAARYPMQSEQYLYYSRLGENGDQVVSMPFERKRVVSSSVPAYQSETNSPNQIAISEIEAYHPLPYLLPNWWAPYLWLNHLRSEAGIITGSQDPIGRHQYQFYLGYESQQQLPLGWINYQYSKNRYIWTLQAKRKASFTSNKNTNKLERVDISNEWAALYERAFLKYNKQWSWILGAGQEKYYERAINSTTTAQPSQTWSYLGLALSYNSSKRYLRSISPMDGSTLNIVLEQYQGDAEGNAGRIDWRHYLRLGQQQSLALRFLYADRQKSTPILTIGREDVNPLKLPAENYHYSLFNNQDIALRGYPANLNSYQIAIGSMEWHLPLARIERSLMSPPIGMGQLYGSLFYDVANLTSDNSSNRTFKSIGAELHSELVLGYQLPSLLGIGIAKGLDKQGETQLYLSLKVDLDSLE